MTDFTFKGFNHTGFVVTELDRPVAFFTELLGFELLSRAPREDALIERMTTVARPDVEIVHLQGPGHRVELVRYGTDAGRSTRRPRVFDDGSAHLAFDVDDVEAAVRAAEPYGFAVTGEVITIDGGPNKGRKVVYMESPDGLLIEFIEAP